MRCFSRIVVVLVLVGAALFGGLAPAEPQDKGKKKKDAGAVSGARWEYRAVGDDDKELASGQWRAYDRKVFRGGKQIGTYDQTSKEQIKLEITEGSLKGKIELQLTKSKPPTWRGELVRGDGGKVRITLRNILD